MTFQINPNKYRHVEVFHSIADVRGGGVGHLDLQVKVVNTTVKYQVVHNKIIKYQGDSSYEAACKFNEIIKICEAEYLGLNPLVA